MTEKALDYDVVIVGAGIQGAGVAQICALNGLRVLVLEQYTAGSQTSSRSSKLIHGGLRYLETWQWGLVRECLKERAILLNVAPDLVKLVPFYIPVYKSSSRSALKIRAGLSLYALLGGLTKDCRFRKVPLSEWDSLNGLERNNLVAVYQYFDAQTDDQQLTRAVLQSAISLGAEYHEQASFERAELSASHVQLVWSGREHEMQAQRCKTRVLVNASGPWVNHVLNSISPKQSLQDIELVQGAHIILDTRVSDSIFYLEAEQDNRAVFVMPWKDQTMVGTTETMFEGDPVDVKPLDEEIEYLHSVFRRSFPAHANSKVVKSFAGLRVLPTADGSAFARSRDTRIIKDNEDKPSLITICGGKLTAYRLSALKIFRSIATALELEDVDYGTDKLEIK